MSVLESKITVKTLKTNKRLNNTPKFNEHLILTHPVSYTQRRTSTSSSLHTTLAQPDKIISRKIPE